MMYEKYVKFKFQCSLSFTGIQSYTFTYMLAVAGPSRRERPNGARSLLCTGDDLGLMNRSDVT